jgi:F-type H+-transporting ATPase subunit delta
VTDPKLARRYAQALYAAARQAEEVDGVMQAVTETLTPLVKDEQFRLFWYSRRVPMQRQLELIDSLFEAFPASLRNFLKLLLEKKREGILADVIGALRGIHDEASGTVRATLTTAVKLSDEEAEPFEAMLAKRVGGGNIVLTRKVDPSLIGGFRIRYGDRIIDGSVERSLGEISRRLTA